MRRVVLLSALLALSACSTGQVLGTAAGALTGGPDMSASANVQAGRTNAQTGLATTEITEQAAPRVRAREIETLEQTTTQTADRNAARADRVETIVVHESAPWLIAFALLGWVLPTPGQIGQAIGRAVTAPFRRGERDG